MNSFGNDTIMNRMLFKSYELLNGKWEPNSKYEFLVYSEIWPSVRNLLKNQGVKYLPDVWAYQLKLNGKVYKMKLIFLTRISEVFANYMQNLVEISQFTFLWNGRSTLFRALDQYHELEEFISLHNLNSYISREELFVGVNSKDQVIKCLTFNKKVNYQQLVQEFKIFLDSKHINESNNIYHYFVTFALPWQQPSRLHHFSKPLKNKRIIFGLQTFLTCMRELSYKQEPYLDFIGLCSLKLAFCDDRKLTFATTDLEYEICAVIQRSLKKMAIEQTYIRNNEFILSQYAADRNCAPDLNDISGFYFQYRFQEYFKSVRMSNIVTRLNLSSNFKPGLEPPNFYIRPSFHVQQTIKLVEEMNILRKLNDMSNAGLIIDGENYSKMNHKLFCDIVNFRNIQSIILDTNYEWSNINADRYKGNANQSIIHIWLIGENKVNFIEGFMASLLNISNLHNLNLIIQPKLEDYRILKDLNVCLIGFSQIKITRKMLKELQDSTFKRTQLHLLCCNIEDDMESWKLLNELNIAQAVIIQEENTWQHLFEYVADYLKNFERNEFQFKIKLLIVFDNDKSVDLNQMKFTFDEFSTRLEIRDVTSGEMADLYYLKNTLNEIEDGDNPYGLNK